MDTKSMNDQTPPPAPASLDLDGILARLEARERTTISPWSFSARLLWSEPLDAAIRDDVRALVAEVERLRAEISAIKDERHQRHIERVKRVEEDIKRARKEDI